jgi:hypothetical protein
MLQAIARRGDSFLNKPIHAMTFTIDLVKLIQEKTGRL